MRAVLALMVLCVVAVAWIGGYYYHLNHVERTTPRSIFNCSKTSLVEDGEVVRVWISNCKRNGRSVNF